MVIVLMNAGPDRTAGAALATEIGWPLVAVEAGRLEQLRRLLQASINRRRSLLVTTGPLTRADRAAVARDLAPVRFVSLSPLDEPGYAAPRAAEEPLDVSASPDPRDLGRTLRTEFGV